jgi:nitrous oxidase accessory protein NosD/nitrous oxide reductase accessory protein NosL
MQTRLVVLGVVVILVLGSVPFAVGVSPNRSAGAVDFDDTISVGISEGVVREAQRSSLVVPKAQVFYSQYRYPVGYYGVTSLVTDLQTRSERGLGRPLQIYVTDFSDEPVRLDADGTLRLPEVRKAGWVRASDAFFVVESCAHVPTRQSVIVPFSNQTDAIAFASKYGGQVAQWDEVRSRETEPIGHTTAEWERITAEREVQTDSKVTARRTLLDRPVSVVVGEDAPTLADAVRSAPPNTSIRVPAGTYNVSNVSITKPVAIRGAGQNRTHLVGDGTGTVMTITSPRTAITNLSLSGVGPARSGNNVTAGAVAVNKTSWNYNMRKVHGYGDAAIVFDSAGRSLVSRIRINTTSNGIIARDSPNLTITNLTVYGTKRWNEGFLGVAAIGSPVVVQDSAFYGGKVGVFALDVDDLVVRDSQMEGMMLGVFNLYGRNHLIRDNWIEDTGYGIYVEMRSSETAVVDNTVRGSKNGIIVAGTANYVAENVVTQSRAGLLVEGHYSLYRRNVIAYNRVGLRSLTLLPTNTVTDNDVVRNRKAVTTSAYDIIHVWRGNYWSNAPGVRRRADGSLIRSFRPTGPVDSSVGRVSYVKTVAHSPTVTALRQLQQFVPGLRKGGVVDPAPVADPIRDDVVQRVRQTSNRTGELDDDDSWNFRS